MNTDMRVAILLCTYNGSKFLRKQLDSIINQTHPNWVIYVSDDGSTDDTIDILKEYQLKIGSERFSIFRGPNQGFAWNFISLLEKAGDGFDYYAFSDQDDEWLDNKLTHQLTWFNDKDAATPSVHCGRTLLIDETGGEIGFSPLFAKKPSFRNALVQSIAGGNTMMLNSAARNIVVETTKWDEIISHDWWIYILVSGCGGRVFYDPVPTIRYRQHSSNIIGSNLSMTARFQRIQKLMSGHFKSWNDKNLQLLLPFKDNLSAENRKIHSCFVSKRNGNLFARLKMVIETRLYRQTNCGNIALIAAIIFNKI
jgi:glycosyltransferase involved in cell wall biosynthesis